MGSAAGVPLSEVAEVVELDASPPETLSLRCCCCYCCSGTSLLPILDVTIGPVCVFEVATEVGMVTGVGPGFTKVHRQQSSVTQRRSFTSDTCTLLPFCFLKSYHSVLY